MFDFYGNERDRRPPSDEISLFVHQLLLRSSSSSAMACGGPQDQPPTEDAQDLTRKGEVETRASSSSEDMEFFVDDEVQPKAAVAASPPPRSSSKRSRAAEVHNMSEKRRRSRINEKMKALQNLIPNSNKTDKASMLDEAIEYLKQLQLQVQMLSMRNGISLHSTYLPRSMQSSQISQLRFGFGEENQTQNLSFIGTFALNQDSPVQTTSTLRKPSTISSQLSVPDIADVLGSETSCNTKSSFQAHLGAFMLHKSLDACSPVPPRSNYKPQDGENPTILHACSSNEVCLEDVLPHENLYENHPENNPSEFGIGAMVVGSLPFEACASNPRDSSSQEVCETGQTNVLLENTKGDLFRISDFTMQTRSAPNSAMN